MQTSKFLVIVGVAATGMIVSFHALAGPDNAEEARIREALRQKMEQLNAQAAPVAPPAVEAQPVPPAPVPVPVVKQPPAVNTPTVVVPVPAEPMPVMVPPAPTPVPVVRNSGGNATVFSPVPEAKDDADEARLREMLRQKIAADRASAPAPVVPVPNQPVAPKKPSAPVAGSSKVTPPSGYLPPATIEIAPSPFTKSQQQRLADLLRLYEADTITPQEYHTKRAEIIAQP